MAIDVELKTLKQSNTTWPSTFKASNRFPIVANRVFATLEKAQQYVDDTAADASAYKGIVLAVVEDSIAKNNGVYYVESVAMAEGETGKLVKVGGTETETAKNYSAAKTLSNTLVLGQLIKVSEEETITEGEGEEAKEVTYQAGFYIVEGAGVISALATSTGSDDEVGALKGRVSALETTVGNEEAGLVKEVADLKEAVEAIEIPEVPVQDVTVDGASVLNKETGVAEITMPDVTVYETIENVNKVRKDVSANTEAIESLAGVVGKAAEGENEATGLVKAVAENAAAIETKVAKEDGKRLMTDAEGTKLAGIAEGAQVNVIEVVKVNGQALSVAAGDKSVDVIVPTAPVQGVAAEEKVLSLDGDKLKTTLTLAYVPATETDNAVLRLQGKDGAVVSSIDATAFVKDGMLEGAKLEGPKEGESGEKYLVLTFNTAAGKEDIRMDVSSLLDYYAAGDGLALDGKTFAIKLDATAESYLKVTTNGLAVADALWTKVTELDNAVLDAAKGDATSKANAAQAAATAYTDTAIANLELDKNYEAKGTAQGLIDGLKLADTYEAKGTAAGLLKTHEEAMETVLAGKANVDDSYLKAEADAKFVAQVEGERLMTDAEGTKLAGIAEGAQVNKIEAIKVNGVDATVAEGGKLAEVEIAAKDIALGGDITGATGEAIYSGETKISTVLQGIQDSIRAAVAGGVNSVTSADSIIEVNNADANNPKVSLKVETASDNTVAAGHIEIVKGENGVYGMMYYDGDDAE